MGPTLEARLYTLEYSWCVPSTRRTRRSLLSMPSPPPTGEVARRTRWTLLISISSTSVRLTPAPSPTRAVSRSLRRKFYYSLRLLLVPTALVGEIIILFEIYTSFSRFQYELLVHTPNTDVYRRILECSFTHFAPYVALSLGPRPSPTWWTCSNSFGIV